MRSCCEFRFRVRATRTVSTRTCAAGAKPATVWLRRGSGRSTRAAYPGAPRVWVDGQEVIGGRTPPRHRAGRRAAPPPRNARHDERHGCGVALVRNVLGSGPFRPDRIEDRSVAEEVTFPRDRRARVLRQVRSGAAGCNGRPRRKEPRQNCSVTRTLVSERPASTARLRVSKIGVWRLRGVRFLGARYAPTPVPGGEARRTLLFARVARMPDPGDLSDVRHYTARPHLRRRPAPNLLSQGAHGAVRTGS